MNKTSIEWVKNPDGSQGYTWNPITGCLNGCDYCYARKLANTRLRERYLANTNLAPLPKDYLGYHEYPHSDPFYPRFWEDRLEPIGLTGGNKRPHSYGYLGGFKEHKPKGIFVCDMSDLFGIGIPEEWTRRVLDTIKGCPQHRFYLLTKQPQNLIKWSPFPDNCWVGVSITSSKEHIIHHLRDVEAKVKYISYEPLLYWDMNVNSSLISQALKVAGINQVIIGAQTKPTMYPKIEWVTEIVEACDKAGIPVFLKNNLRTLLEDEPLSSLFWANVENDERGHERSDDELRQEMPQGGSNE